MKTLIKSKFNSKELVFSNTLVKNIWLERNTQSFISTSDYSKSVLEIIRKATQTIVLMVNSVCCINKQNLIIELQNAIKRGVRVYILTDNIDDWSGELNGLALFRETILPELVLLLTDTSNEIKSGFICSNLANNNSSLGFQLSEEQIQSLFEYFCRLFWMDAKFERLLDKNLSVKPKPNDIVLPLINRNWIPNNFPKTGNNVFCPNISELDTTVESNLLVCPNSDLKTNTCQNIRANSELEKITFSLVLEPIDSFISFKSNKKEKFILKLNDEQIQIAESWFKNQFDAAPLVWKRQVSRIELLNQIFYFPANINQKLTVSEKSEIKLDPIILDLNLTPINPESLNQIPEEKAFQDDNKSNRIEYHWIVKPPSLPENSKPHQIYKEWTSFEAKWQSFKNDYPNKMDLNFEDWKQSALKQINVILEDFEDTADSEKLQNKDAKKEQEIKRLKELKNNINNLTEPKSKPSLGELYNLAGKNYLVIEFWEEIPEAQEVSKLFENAKIVIKS